ncbi:hypothetical protein EJB05_44393 [Eragrostis curvula]|uniref:Uncharacterized protein n=1 Tax=Eragrostis curvula TaxID=38414 RepID=A0A5J9THJ2_9POAL|nr:hypothetical protein EJB05_44393 [Eragrostis curvula]
MQTGAIDAAPNLLPKEHQVVQPYIDAGESSNSIDKVVQPYIDAGESSNSIDKDLAVANAHPDNSIRISDGGHGGLAVLWRSDELISCPNIPALMQARVNRGGHA